MLLGKDFLPKDRLYLVDREKYRCSCIEYHEFVLNGTYFVGLGIRFVVFFVLDFSFLLC